MAVAGVGWGIYSFRGRLATDALASTSGNFLRSVPFAILLALLARQSLHASRLGLGLALVSGGIASALGYILWYAALRDLLAVEAALAGADGS
jgi:drug/metabolite transporter (DMT)-like permease